MFELRGRAICKKLFQGRSGRSRRAPSPLVQPPSRRHCVVVGVHVVPPPLAPALPGWMRHGASRRVGGWDTSCFLSSCASQGRIYADPLTVRRYTDTKIRTYVERNKQANTSGRKTTHVFDHAMHKRTQVVWQDAQTGKHCNTSQKGNT